MLLYMSRHTLIHTVDKRKPLNKYDFVRVINKKFYKDEGEVNPEWSVDFIKLINKNYQQPKGVTYEHNVNDFRKLMRYKP